MNSVDSEKDHLNLGGGDESSEPEGEKSNDEGTENTQYAGMNKFGPLAEEYDWNEDYNNQYYGPQSDWGWGPPGLYTLKRIEEERPPCVTGQDVCGEKCECGFKKMETKAEKKNRIRNEAFNKNKTPGKVMTMGNKVDQGWMEIDAIVDSGAIDTIAPKSMVEGLKIRQTEVSRRNGKYASADGGVIHNLGECDMEGVAEDGTPMKLVTQVGDKVMNMLISVRRMVESGNMVVFGANQQALRKLAACNKIEKNMIVGKNGKKSEIKDEDGVYVFKMKIKKGKNDMDLGNVNKGKDDAQSTGVDYSIEDPF